MFSLYQHLKITPVETLIRNLQIDRIPKQADSAEGQQRINGRRHVPSPVAQTDNREKRQKSSKLAVFKLSIHELSTTVFTVCANGTYCRFLVSQNKTTLSLYFTSY